MLLHDKLKHNTVILASASPRRRELLAATGIAFRIASKFDCEEQYPTTLPTEDVAPYLSRLKSHAYPFALECGDILITADTTVLLGNAVLGKPASEAEARTMLRSLSGREHSVVTGVTLRSKERERTFASTSKVRFTELSDEQIEYYIANYAPMDKAGAYGIQGLGGLFVSGIRGDWYTVVGMPLAELYGILKDEFSLDFFALRSGETV